MQIGITNPLREFLRWRAFPPYGGKAATADPLFCWDAHRLKVDGRVMLVVCNAANRFTGVMAMRAADWKRLGESCEQAIAWSMLSAGFSQAAVGAYLTRAGDIEFGRTHGRKAVGCMNRMIDTLLWCECDHGNQFQPYLCYMVNMNDIGSCATREGYGMAAERMADDLRAHGIDPFDADADNRPFDQSWTEPPADILPAHLRDAAAKAAADSATGSMLTQLDALIAEAGDTNKAHGIPATGSGRIEDVPFRSIVIDGRRYTGDEFLNLLDGYVGLSLHWTLE